MAERSESRQRCGQELAPQFFRSLRSAWPASTDHRDRKMQELLGAQQRRRAAAREVCAAPDPGCGAVGVWRYIPVPPVSSLQPGKLWWR